MVVVDVVIFLRGRVASVGDVMKAEDGYVGVARVVVEV